MVPVASSVTEQVIDDHLNSPFTEQLCALVPILVAGEIGEEALPAPNAQRGLSTLYGTSWPGFCSLA